jgi:hypothetical protein
MPTQNTKLVMSHAQPTGWLRPQMPIPSQNSHDLPEQPRHRHAEKAEKREGREEEHPPAERRAPFDGFRDGVGDRVEIRRPEDQRRMARDRVV